jgi:hypothetical protein
LEPVLGITLLVGNAQSLPHVVLWAPYWGRFGVIKRGVASIKKPAMELAFLVVRKDEV